MSYIHELRDILKEVLSIAEREHKLTGFCIGNTSKVDDSRLYFTPIRNTRDVIAGSAIVYQAHHAAEIAAFVDGRVNYVFVDSEKKSPPDPQFFGPMDHGNIERAVRDVVKHSRVLTYKGNDLTVNSVDCLLAQMVSDPIRGIGGKKVAIIGAGNLGSKLALKLVERGASIVITRRDKTKLDAIVTALNYIKPAQTIAEITGTTNNEEAAQDADILIGASRGSAIVTGMMIDLLAPNALVMDAGKGCLSPEAEYRVRERGFIFLRVDVRAGFAGEFAMIMETEKKLASSLGRRTLKGVAIVSAGLFAWKDEIVVDNLQYPTAIYGVADGKGEFVRVLSSEQAERMRVLQEYIRSQRTQDAVGFSGSKVFPAGAGG